MYIKKRKNYKSDDTKIKTRIVKKKSFLINFTDDLSKN